MDVNDLRMGPNTLEAVMLLSANAGNHWFHVHAGAHDLYDRIRWSRKVYPSAGGTIFIEGRTYHGETGFRGGGERFVVGRRYVICSTDHHGTTHTYRDNGWDNGDIVLYKSLRAAHRQADILASRAVMAGIIIGAAARRSS